MNFYEFNLLITSDFSEEKITAFNEELISGLKEYGEIKGEIDFKQKKLAYSVQKENEAWLTVFNFYLKGDNKKEALSSIEKILKEKKEILRYLILSKKEVTEKPQKRIRRKEEKTEEKAEEKKEAPEEANVEKVDKKVEELLKEES